VADDMIRASSVYDVYDRCGELFAAYPLAVRNLDRIRSVRSMVLVVPAGESAAARFFVLARYDGEGGGGPRFSVVPWQGDGPPVSIHAGSRSVPAAVARAVVHGTPMPRHGSLFGWLQGKAVSALIAVYADHAPGYPDPSWAVMPLAGTPHEAWPPFTTEDLPGSWFWEYSRKSRIVSLAGLIAATPGTVFWVDTEKSLGWDCCVVARDITDDAAAGYVLPRGCYLYYEGLRPPAATPPVETLLARSGKTDLAPRLRPLAGQES
jgi:hypothetical protein